MSPAAGSGRDLDVLRGMMNRVDPNDPGAFNNLGVLYHTRGLHAESVEAFLRALAIDPRMRTASRNLETAARQPGACDARLEALTARMAADPDDRDALREHARLLRLIGRVDEATRELDALIAEDPDDAAALFERGLIEQRVGDLRRAQRWFERAVNAQAVGDARLHLAEVLYQRGQNEQALQVLDELLIESPEHAEAHLLRGFVLGDMGRHEAALVAARTAARLDPRLETVQGDLLLDGSAQEPVAQAVMQVEGDGALARHGLGLAFRQRGYFREARREFERALEQGEDAQLVQHALAELDLLDGLSDEARQRYDLLLNGAESARLWNEHGVALHQGGKVEAAAESYRRALRIDPRHALAYNNLGVALADRGDAQAAREALLRATELDPTLVLARVNLARWAVLHGEAYEALTLLREVVAFHPREADAWHVLGVVLRQVGRPEDAREALVQAIEHRPTHAEARYVLAEVLASLGDDEGAARETEGALGLASVRRPLRLAVAVALQQECPDAVGPVDLLALGSGVPLEGVTFDASQVADWLPEQPRHVAPKSPVARALDWCEQADAFAERGLHGEAVERYRAAHQLLLDNTPDGEANAVAQPEAAADDTVAQAVRHAWHRALRGEARTLCLLGRADEALPLLQRVLPDAPHDAELLTLQAAALLGNSDSAARAALLRVLGQDCDSAALLHFAGDLASRLGDAAIALGAYRRALALDPTRPTPRVAIARVLRERGDLLAARLELVAALATAPTWRDAICELALVHRDAGRLEESRRLLVAQLQRVPTDLGALEQLTDVLVAEERMSDARVAVDRLLRHEPDRAGAWWFDAVLLADQARWRDALSRWEALAQRADAAPWNTRAQEALARAAALSSTQRAS